MFRCGGNHRAYGDQSLNLMIANLKMPPILTDCQQVETTASKNNPVKLLSDLELQRVIKHTLIKI